MKPVLYFYQKEIPLNAPRHPDIPLRHAPYFPAGMNGIVQGIGQDNAEVVIPQAAGVWRRFPAHS